MGNGRNINSTQPVPKTNCVERSTWPNMDGIDGLIMNGATESCCNDNNGGSTCQKEEKILKCVRSLEIQDDTNCNVEKLIEFTETKDLTVIQRTKKGKQMKRVDTRESTLLDKSSLVSEIFVRYPKKDIDKEESLGGFVSTILRSDGAFLHAFCSLDQNGIFAKDLHVKNKDILVSLNGIKVLGSFTHDHAGIVEIFRNLPMSKTISMVKYNRQTDTFTTIEFLLEISSEEIIVKEDSVKLMNKPPTVEVLVCPKTNKSLAYTNGQLNLCHSGDVLSNCAHHFVVTETLSDLYFASYTFQVQIDESKYLCLKGGRLDVIDKSKGISKFRIEQIKRDLFLKSDGYDNKYIHYNNATGKYELGTWETAVADGLGLLMHRTDCKP